MSQKQNNNLSLNNNNISEEIPVFNIKNNIPDKKHKHQEYSNNITNNITNKEKSKLTPLFNDDEYMYTFCTC